MTTKILLPFRYPGGKYYALSLLKPFWSVPHDEYREALVGGGAVFFAKEKAKYNWINDVHSDLITVYQTMANPNLRAKLVDLLVHEQATRERHEEIRKMTPKNDLERAFKFYYLNRTSFSGKTKQPYWGFRPKRSLPPERWGERINECGEKLHDVEITNYDFEEVLLEPGRGKRVLLYLDPPYYGVRREDHYTHLFSRKDHERLANLLQETTFHFFLTYDDVPEIRELYSWAHIYPVSFFYRIGNSQEINGKREKGSELIISNYKVQNEKQLPLDQFYTNGDDDLAKGKFKKEILPKQHKKIKKKNYEMPSPFRYPGGKLLACRYIRPFWEVVPHQEYREPFAGSAAVFFAKPLASQNWLNDSDSGLMNTYSVIADKKQLNELVRQVEGEKPSKERHTYFKNLTPQSELEAAIRYYFLNRTSYSGIMHKPAWGYREDKSSNPDKWRGKLFPASEKLKGVKLTSTDFSEVITAPAEGTVLMFVDPPYYESDQKRAYANHFSKADHERLCHLLEKTKYNFILTYDNCAAVRTLYSWANIHPFSWQYNTANLSDTKRNWGNELIITNF